MVIDSLQQSESLPADQLIGHEVHAPAVIGTLSDRTSFANLNALPPTWLSPPDFMSFFAVQPVHELLVHEPPFPTQEHPEPRISELHPTGRQVSKSYAKLGPRITPAPVTVGRSGKPKNPASSAFSHPIRHLHLPHQNTLHRGPHSFFESTSCSIFLSRLRSATSCLSFRFSSSMIRSRRSSAMPSPANRFFHR